MQQTFETKLQAQYNETQAALSLVELVKRLNVGITDGSNMIIYTKSGKWLITSCGRIVGSYVSLDDALVKFTELI